VDAVSAAHAHAARPSARTRARTSPPACCLGADAAHAPARLARTLGRDGDAWLEYIEDGPDEVVTVLKAARTREASAPDVGRSPSGHAPGELPVWRSPDGDGRHQLSMRRLGSYAAAADAEAKAGVAPLDITDAAAGESRAAAPAADSSDAARGKGTKEWAPSAGLEGEIGADEIL